MTFQSRCRLLLLVHLAVFISVAVRSQQKNDTLTQLLDYSRPGEAHQRLAAIEGSWNFQDARRAYVKGVLIRKAIFEGRFYSVEITGGKLPLPVANGIMKEDNYRSLQGEDMITRERYISLRLSIIISGVMKRSNREVMTVRLMRSPISGSLNYCLATGFGINALFI